MTLVDFFTLTEMKEGLTAPGRVKELINVLQKDKHNITKNVSDSARQWCTVAHTIAATENKNCLALFLESDGLCYFDTWLKNGQKCFQETGDNLIEEAVIVLLGAIEKLLIDKQKSVISGIMMTVKDLLSNKSSRVQDRARALVDIWKQNNESNVVHKDVDKAEGVCDNLVGINGNLVGENNGKDVDVEKEDPCLNNNFCGDVKKEVSEGKDDMCDSKSPNPCSNVSAFESTDPADVLQGSYVNEHIMGENKNLTTNLSRKEDTGAIKKSNGQNVSEAEVRKGNEDLTKNLSVKKGAEAIEESNGQNVYEEDEVDLGNKDLTTNLSRKEDIELIEESNGQNVFEENDVLTTNLSRKENTGEIEKSNSQIVTDDDDDDEVVWGNDIDISMSEADEEHSVAKKSGFQLDYDMFDPLEVARQVAIEVEREVDSREPSCSSSERTSGDGKRLLESPDFISEKNSRVINRPFEDISTGRNLSAVVGDEVFVKAKNLANERGNCIVDIEPAGVNEVALNKEPEEDNNVCGFDLNEDVLSDFDTDNQINPVTAAISVVSASRAAATSGLHLSPLQFEGTLGWKGSAEASAFRTASTCKISEGDNSIFASGSSRKLFRRKEYLDFDLNVAEGEDNITNLLPSKEIPNLTGRTSRNYSLEVSQHRSDLLRLDLNCVSDSGDAPLSHWRKEERVLPHCNGPLSPSASSSSSSMQRSLKTIDLNDQPSPFTEFLHPDLTVKSSTTSFTSGTGGFKTDESVISLMGARVKVGQKDNVPQTVPLFNGRIVDPGLDASMTRNDGVMGLASSSLYAHSYMYGYSGPSSGPTVPYSSAIYGLGQIPYMVDSRGTHVVPQVLGPVQPLPPSFPQQPSFLESLAAAPTDSNGFVPPRHGFDLNSGLMIEGRSRNAGNLTLFSPGQGISIDEQMRANSQSASSSGVGGKRKEADGGWDPYPFNYKHHQPPWK
ncbi:TFIIS N-terminal domain-containing protein [Heracleum sosnowskyi]|uniref:TFIIS N-terminal domain-containing protein n=1 Tax=Heracleum sosnowskyi TaxID=360622 RepID=A0AAD8H982_9APIA|nr:TFIIS N-terminal domain-containing protein [Heracleum sosnowskyi]